MSDRISARIDPDLKHNAAAILNQLGVSEAEAIRMFYSQIIINRGIPFDVKIPNKETLEALMQDPTTMESYSVDEFFEHLDTPDDAKN